MKFLTDFGDSAVLLPLSLVVLIYVVRLALSFRKAPAE